MKTLLVHLCLAATLLLAADDATTKPADFAPKDGRFTVQMPGEPKEQTSKVNTPIGPIDVHLFISAPDPKSAYMVGYSDYPEEVVKKSDSDKILDGARDGAVRNVKGTLESEKKITMDGHPGRDYVISTEGFRGRERIYLVNARLYQVMLLGSKEFVTGKDADKFLDSFKLTEK